MNNISSSRLLKGYNETFFQQTQYFHPVHHSPISHEPPGAIVSNMKIDKWIVCTSWQSSKWVIIQSPMNRKLGYWIKFSSRLNLLKTFMGLETMTLLTYGMHYHCRPTNQPVTFKYFYLTILVPGTLFLSDYVSLLTMHFILGLTV